MVQRRGKFRQCGLQRKGERCKLRTGVTAGFADSVLSSCSSGELWEVMPPTVSVPFLDSSMELPGMSEVLDPTEIHLPQDFVNWLDEIVLDRDTTSGRRLSKADRVVGEIGGGALQHRTAALNAARNTVGGFSQNPLLWNSHQIGVLGGSTPEHNMPAINPKLNSAAAANKPVLSSGRNPMSVEDFAYSMGLGSRYPVGIDTKDVEISRPKRRNVKISKDPQSVAARHRREKISDRIRVLQRLVPGGTKMDTASMLDTAIMYVKFLQGEVERLNKESIPGSPGLDSRMAFTSSSVSRSSGMAGLPAEMMWMGCSSVSHGVASIQNDFKDGTLMSMVPSHNDAKFPMQFCH